MGIVLAILTALLLGTSNIFLKKSFKDFPPSISFFILAVYSLLTWLPLGLYLGVDFNHWILGICVGVASALLGQAIYIYVLEKGELSITATLLSSFPIYTILFSTAFLSERPHGAVLLIVMLAIIGTLIVSMPERFNSSELRKVSFIAWAVFAAICIGASDTFAKYFINQTGVGSFLFYVSIAQLFVSFVYLKYEKQPFSQFKAFITRFGEYRNAFIGSFCIATATMCLFLSFNYTLASIASPIAGTAPVITIILAMIFLKDRITPKNLVGLTLVLVAIIGIGIFSGH